jgi:hypothetical protein
MPTKDSKQVTFRWDDETRELVLMTPREEIRLAGDRARELFDLLYRHRHQLGDTAPALPEWAMPDNEASSPTIKLLRPAVPRYESASREEQG